MIFNTFLRLWSLLLNSLHRRFRIGVYSLKGPQSYLQEVICRNLIKIIQKLNFFVFKIAFKTVSLTFKDYIIYIQDPMLLSSLLIPTQLVGHGKSSILKYPKANQYNSLRQRHTEICRSKTTSSTFISPL